MVLPDSFFKEPKPDAQDERNGSTRGRSLEESLAAPIDRLAAFVADLVILLPIAGLLIAPFRRQAQEARVLGSDPQWLLALGSAAIAGVIAVTLYQTIFVALFGGTPGKLALRLRVVSVFSGGRPRPIEAFQRSLVWCFEVLFAGIPWLAVFSNERRRPWHDRAGDTAVISLTSRRKAGLATLPEISMASGFQSAALAMVALVATIHINEFRLSAASDAALIAEQEEEGRLCGSVREALKEWPERKGTVVKDRLEAALALYSADELDANCLDAEANYALWREGEKPLAYLAKALVTGDHEKSDGYFEKTCAGDDDSDACKMATLSRLVDEELAGGDEADGAQKGTAEAKAQEVARENELATLSSSLRKESGLYLRFSLIKFWMQRHEYGRALDAMEEAGPMPRKVAAQIARERTKALWSLDQKAEARLALRSSADLVDVNARVDLARWFCFNETLTEGCSDDARVSCGLVTEAVDRFDGWLMKPEVSAAYIRGSQCKGVMTVARWNELENQLPLPEAKAFARAMALVESGKKEEGVEQLKLMASVTGGGTGAFFLEANAQLADLAESSKELSDIESSWAKLESANENWKPLGSKILKKWVQLRAWDKALSLGLKISEGDRYDRGLYRTMVVAAYRSGQKQMALGLLENFNRLQSMGSARQPASADGFDEIVLELARSRRGGP